MDAAVIIRLVGGAALIGIGSLCVATAVTGVAADSEKGSASTAPAAPAALVVFHANWCGACKGFMPTWPSVANAMVPYGVAAHAFEADEHRAIVEASSVRAYPTIRLYPRGFHPRAPSVQYDGPRSPEAIAVWVRAQLGA